MKIAKIRRTAAAPLVKSLVVSCFFLLLFSLFSAPGFGAVKPLYTYYNPFYGARSLGLGNAFTAVADDLTAVYRNPAGIAEFAGPKIFVDYRADRLKYDYAPQEFTSGDTVQTYTYNFSSTLRNLDFVSISVPVYFWDINWNFALSYYRLYPYGFEGQLREEFLTGNGSGDSLTTLTLSGGSGIDVLGFTTAFYLTDYFSFGITLQQFINSGDMMYKYYSPTESYTRTYTEKINERNLVLGLMGKLTRDIIIGVTYQTRFTADFDTRYSHHDTGSGVTTTVVSYGTRAVFPAQLAVGLLLKPYPFMRASFEYSIFYWSDARLYDYYGSSQELKFPERDDFTFAQKDTVNYRMGVELNIPMDRATIFLRAGLFRDQQLFVDGETPPAPVKFSGFSLGLGIDVLSMVQVDIGYMRQKSFWNEVAYFDPAAYVRTNYKNDIFAISLTYSFGKRKEN